MEREIRFPRSRPNSNISVGCGKAVKVYLANGGHNIPAVERERREKEFYTRPIFQKAKISPLLVDASVTGRLVTEIAGRQTIESLRNEFFSAGKTKDLAEKLFVGILAVERLERKMARLDLRHGDLECRHIFVTITKKGNRYKGRTTARLIDWETWQEERFSFYGEFSKLIASLKEAIGEPWCVEFSKKYPTSSKPISIGPSIPKGMAKCYRCKNILNKRKDLIYSEYFGAKVCYDCLDTIDYDSGWF